MEQISLQPEVARYVSAILKMMELTQHGKIKWSKEITNIHMNPSHWRAKYTTIFDGKTFVLLVSPQDRLMGGTVDAINGFTTGNPVGLSRVSLQAFEPNGDKIMDFPKVSPLEGLVSVVQNQAGGREESLLQAIETA